MSQILEIDITDDITAIRSRIELVLPGLIQQARAAAEPGQTVTPRLLLVVPNKNKALHSLVNMKLLARLLKKRSVELALVSQHPTVRDYAKEAGVRVFGSIRAARRAGWVSQTAEIIPAEKTEPPTLADDDTPAAEPAPTTAPARPRRRKRRQKPRFVLVIGKGEVDILQQLLALLLIAVLAAALALAAVMLLPRAVVVVTPQPRPVQAELVVHADPNEKSIDYETASFPARVDQVELNVRGQIETVKTELAPVGRAEGTVVFINRTLQEQVIPISTTVTTSAGEPIEFITTLTATIPAGVGAITPTTVIAVEPGPQGNVAAGTVNRIADPRLALVARVINDEPFSGGTMEPARVVEQADKERLRAHLQQLTYQQGLEELQNSLGEQEFIPPETLQVIVLDISFDQFAGDVSDFFSGEMHAVVRGTVIGGYNANRLALAALEQQVPPGYELDIEGLHFAAGEVLDVTEGVVTFMVEARGRAVPVIDPHQAAREIRWLSVGEAQARLSQLYDLADTPAVELQPDWAAQWVGRLPFSPLRIEVVVNPAAVPAAGGS